MRVPLFVMSACWLATALPVLAHHSFAAEFDTTKPVTLNGSVTKLEWGNPHIWVYLEVKDDQGSVQLWQCEGGAPNTLFRNGWSRNALKPGDQVLIDGYAAFALMSLMPGFARQDAFQPPSGLTPRLPSGKVDLSGVWEKPYVPDMTKDGKDQKGMPSHDRRSQDLHQSVGQWAAVHAQAQLGDPRVLL